MDRRNNTFKTITVARTDTRIGTVPMTADRISTKLNSEGDI